MTNRKFRLLFAVCFLAYGSIYIARLNFSVAAAAFEAAGTLTKTQIGVIGSVFSFTFAICKVPGGFMGDRFSAKRVVIAGLVMVGLANLAIGLLPVYGVIIAFWGVNAAGQSLLWGPMLRTLSEHGTDEQYGTASRCLGISIAAGSVGGLLIASGCLSGFGTAACFIVPAAVTLIMAAVCALKMADTPGRVSDEKGGIWGAAKALCLRREFRQMIVPAVFHGVIKDNINVWLAVYFVDAYGVDLSAVAGFVLFIPLMSLAGRLLFPVLYRLVGDEFKITSVSFFLCVLASLYLATGGAPMIAAVVCMGLIAALISIINVHLLSTFPPTVSGRAGLSFTASVMDLLTYGGAGLGSLIFGSLTGAFGYGSMFLVWAAVSAVSLVIVLLVMRERRLKAE